MTYLSRLLTAAVLIGLIVWPAALATAQDDENAPSVQTRAATDIGDRTATLTGSVSGNDSDQSTFRFEYGLTTSYGQSTPTGDLQKSNATRTVTAAIGGLLPDTVYHFRVRASHKQSVIRGEDRSFTTTGSAAVATGTDPGTDPRPDPGAGAGAGTSLPTTQIPLSTAAPEPVLGKSVVVAPLKGTIKIKRPGSAAYATLAAGDAIPVGTVIDTRRGTIMLTSTLPAGTTQAGEFRGALFQVRQARTGRGMTDLVLRGENFARCPRPTGRLGARAAASTKRPQRRLWSRDKGGRFRTHGRNSVATVRGTSWVTTDTCAGTRTTVKAGAVAIRDRRSGKTILVRAGHSYLARSAR